MRIDSFQASETLHPKTDGTPTCESGGVHRDQRVCEAAQRVARAISHMLQNVNQPMRVSGLSAIAGMSTSHFFHVFKEVCGHTPSEFFTRLRIQRACELLRSPKVTVKEVAASVGYADQFYFSRRFKAVTGVAPKQYQTQAMDSL